MNAVDFILHFFSETGRGTLAGLVFIWVAASAALCAFLALRPTVDRGLFNHSGFAKHGSELLAACRHSRRPLSVAVFDCSDLLEVRQIYGSHMARELMARIAAKLTRISGFRGLAARTGPAEFTVVLPGMGRKRALAAIHRVMGKPTRIELDVGHSEIVLVPNFAVDVAGPEFATLQELHTDLLRELAQTVASEQRHHDQMQRDRERHSRPTPLSPRRSVREVSSFAGRLQPTMPMPMEAVA